MSESNVNATIFALTQDNNGKTTTLELLVGEDVACCAAPEWRACGHCAPGTRVRFKQTSSAQYVGCYDNSPDAGRAGGATKDVSFDWCLNKAIQEGKPYFGLEWPNGFATAGHAECVLLDAHPRMRPQDARTDDADCEEEVNADGHRLGNSHRLAVYTAYPPAGLKDGMEGEVVTNRGQIPSISVLWDATEVSTERARWVNYGDLEPLSEVPDVAGTAVLKVTNSDGDENVLTAPEALDSTCTGEGCVITGSVDSEGNAKIAVNGKEFCAPDGSGDSDVRRLSLMAGMGQGMEIASGCEGDATSSGNSAGNLGMDTSEDATVTDVIVGGDNREGDGNTLDGTVKDVSVFNEVLSPTDITAMAPSVAPTVLPTLSPSPLPPKAPVEWNLNDAQSSTECGAATLPVCGECKTYGAGSPVYGNICRYGNGDCFAPQARRDGKCQATATSCFNPDPSAPGRPECNDPPVLNGGATFADEEEGGGIDLDGKDGFVEFDEDPFTQAVQDGEPGEISVATELHLNGCSSGRRRRLSSTCNPYALWKSASSPTSNADAKDLRLAVGGTAQLIGEVDDPNALNPRYTYTSVSMGEDGYVVLGSVKDAIFGGGAGHVGAFSVSLAVNLDVGNAQARIFRIGSFYGSLLELKKGGAGQETTAMLTMMKTTDPGENDNNNNVEATLVACQNVAEQNTFCWFGVLLVIQRAALCPVFSFFRSALQFSDRQKTFSTDSAPPLARCVASLRPYPRRAS